MKQYQNNIFNQLKFTNYEKKTWKRCVCMIGVVLFAVTGLNANNRVPDSPIKKTRSNTFIIEKEKRGSRQVKVWPDRLWAMMGK